MYSLLKKTSLVLAGILSAAVLAEGVMRLGGALILLGQGFGNMGGREAEVRVLCLGESTTQNQYPRMLESVLNSRGHGKKFSVIDKGMAGTNTGIILTKLGGYLEQYRPHVVVTMMGVNDADWAAPLGEAADKRERLTEWVKGWRIVKLARVARGGRFLKKTGEWKQVLLEWAGVPGGERQAQSPGDRVPDERETLVLDPKDEAACLRSARVFRDQGEWVKAEACARLALGLNPNNPGAYLQLADICVGQKNWKESEENYNKALRLDPKSERAYSGLGNAYHIQGKLEKAEESVLRALTLNPKSEEIHLQLTEIYRSRNELKKAEQSARRVLALNDRNEGAYHQLAQIYSDQAEWAKAEANGQRALALSPNNEWILFTLGNIFRYQKKFSKAEECYRKTLALSPRNEDAVDGMLHVAQEKRHAVGSGEAQGRREEDYGYYTGVTVRNYRRMRDVLSARKIKLVCVQYPTRQVEPLKKMVGERRDVFFVDNDDSFRSAVKGRGYWTYFVDKFGGDFGHCTEEGNRLLAENIAEVILSEVLEAGVPSRAGRGDAPGTKG